MKIRSHHLFIARHGVAVAKRDAKFFAKSIFEEIKKVFSLVIA